MGNSHLLRHSESVMMACIQGLMKEGRLELYLKRLAVQEAEKQDDQVDGALA